MFNRLYVEYIRFMNIQSYENVWAPLIISIILIYKLLGVWISNFFVIYI